MSRCRRIVELRRHPSGAFVAKFEVTRWRPTITLRLLSIGDGADPSQAESDAIAALSPAAGSQPRDVQVGHRFEPL